MKIPSRYADDYYNPDVNDEAEANQTVRGAQVAIEQHDRFVDAVTNGVNNPDIGVKMSQADVQSLYGERKAYVMVSNTNKFNMFVDVHYEDKKTFHQAHVARGGDFADEPFGARIFCFPKRQHRPHKHRLPPQGRELRPDRNRVSHA